MRDKNRIKPFLQELESLWLENPDLRFGQLLTIIFDKSNYTDPFFPEEDEWLKWIKQCKHKKS
jgi:uncharacterized protein YihD (DUF1040 family)